MKKINLKNLSMDEVLTKDELKKIVGGNGSGCADFECICYVWNGDGLEVAVIYPHTACTMQDIMDMGTLMIAECENFSGCYAAN